MSRKLAGFVAVYKDDGSVHYFGPDDTVPSWAEKKITNPVAWADGIVADPAPSGESDYPAIETPAIPKKSGRGSGLEAWQEYATASGFEYEDDATRDDLIEALAAEGIPTE